MVIMIEKTGNLMFDQSRILKSKVDGLRLSVYHEPACEALLILSIFFFENPNKVGIFRRI